MNSAFMIIKNIRNLLPYFLLIAIYFFFVNIEARKTHNMILNTQKEQNVEDDTPDIVEKKMRVAIPVIPYNQ